LYAFQDLKLASIDLITKTAMMLVCCIHGLALWYINNSNVAWD
jgi:hypothetical protein